MVRRLMSGTATYGLRFSVNGRQKWLSLGLHGRITPDKARDLARKHTGAVADDRDPVAERKATRAAANERVVLGKVVATYLKDREGEFRPSVLSEQKRYLERYWQPLHDIAIGEIQRQNVVASIDTIADEHGRVAADRARTSLSALFSWAIDKGHCDANPTMNVKPRNQNGPRNRVLSEAELVEVWSTCLDDDYGRIVRLLILTGQRKTEIADLMWTEIDTAKRQIDLPETRTKNAKPHIIPLSDQALAILKAIAHHEDRRLVFGRGNGGFSGWSKSKAEIDARISAARKKAGIKQPMKSWVLHDLRRSFVTHSVESRERTGKDGEVETFSFTLPHVVEAIVNHISGHKAGVAGTYNHAQYLAERRQALDLWGQHVAALVKGRKSNIILMPTRRESA